MGVRIVYRLPIDPFADWLNNRRDRLGMDALCDKIKRDRRWVSENISKRYRTIDLDEVDEVLCNDGTIHIRELYEEELY